MQNPESPAGGVDGITHSELYEETMHHVHYPALILSLIMAGLGILLAFAMYYWKKISADLLAKIAKPLYNFSLNKWYFDELYDATAIKFTLAFSSFLSWFDFKVIDGLVDGTASWTRALTIGPKENWEEGKIGAKFYLTVAGLAALFIGWLTGSAMWPGTAGFWSYLWSALLTIGATGLSFFLFFVGAGIFDNRIIDGLVNGVPFFSGALGLFLRKFQTGKVQTYIVLVVFALLLLILYISPI
jgi:NADH:ubiquinone oxidoreductase subunit 5 (subunit L)/multisubunit Na+/H+ antiporter MnhA subunit